MVRMPRQGPHHEATIAGEFIVPGGDAMHAVEAVDQAGEGMFYPHWALRQPFVAVKIQLE
jgi:hypothetical protein